MLEMKESNISILKSVALSSGTSGSRHEDEVLLSYRCLTALYKRA